MKEENPNIEELLNGYIDGELTERHRTEVERLISHDARIAQRLRELQKCKMLVSSLPRAEAPDEMLEQIKASLEERAPLAQEPSGFAERVGARHLLVRKVLTAAAMIGLVAVLAAVVYTIVVPEGLSGVVAFKGRLVLKTTNLLAVDAAINNAIEHNGISKHGGSGRQGDKNVYVLSSSREAMSSLLGDLKNVWGSFDSATLFVKTKTSGERVVDNVSTEQIADLIIPVMPDLTGPEEPIEKPATPLKDEKKVHLTIVLTGNK
jgi:hypothetical protein